MDLMLRYSPVATVSGWPARSGSARASARSVDEAVPAGQAERGFAGANLHESPEAYLLELPLPGVQAEDVALTVQADRLTLKARRHWAAPPNAQPLARGFGAGDIQQTITLPGDVAPGDLQAELRDGILRLELPKAASARRGGPRAPWASPPRGAPGRRTGRRRAAPAAERGGGARGPGVHGGPGHASTPAPATPLWRPTSGPRAPRRFPSQSVPRGGRKP
jgi:HSP20 family protein